MHPLLNIAKEAAEAAGNVIRFYQDRFDQITVEQKGRNDYVSQCDFEAEQAIIKTIRKYHGNHKIIAEESGVQNGNGDVEWIIDPLDGTTNFLHQFPQFAVSIAVTVKGKLTHAVIYDPIAEEMFTATKGSGAYLNNHRIRVSGQKTLDNALLATGFPYHDFSYIDAYLASFKAFMTSTAGIRRAGSAALDLAYVACGRVDGFWELNLKPWDIAAGALIIKEAGGLATDFAGGENFLESGNIMAANPKMYKEMAQVIGKTIPAELRK
ncbi:inositol monophosphatase [Thiomicrorhabdus sp. 6S2-11]|jgi:myo-inositol-1(or 4)-monophosphatase|uniref:Inositol-1-monophosphatase n=1 Tax=Thiomicrorhabdus marina TaxID=2818442 RepID=A0ABS3Q603_9GAMM|nr:inositol monophosphatase family protein [Thiomicrorhabdus marina]MBO1927737.1 inositol monophosphatase [Thiomicrorhabdus marina]